jgi:hypothetical protein
MVERSLKTNPRICFSAISMFFLVTLSCQPPKNTAGFIDPVFAYAVPSTAKLFSAQVRHVTVLPENGTSAALYAELEHTSPRVVLLSPLLFTEIDAVLSMDESRKVAIFGEYPRPANPRLFQAIFSRTDAARLAGSTAALEARKDPAGAKVAALFAGDTQEALQAVAKAFSESFLASGGSDAPVLELSAEDFSQGIAQKMASLDVQIAYISAPPDVIGRWIREAFDPYAFIIAEIALPDEPEYTFAGTLVVWDIASTLQLLLSGIENENNALIAGKWKIQHKENRPKGGARQTIQGTLPL